MVIAVVVIYLYLGPCYMVFITWYSWGSLKGRWGVLGKDPLRNAEAQTMALARRCSRLRLWEQGTSPEVCKCKDCDLEGHWPVILATWKATSPELGATLAALWATFGYSGLFFWATWRSRYFSSIMGYFGGFFVGYLGAIRAC